MTVSLGIEGLEYNGKSSLSILVAKTLTDTTTFPVAHHREPGGTLLGEHIRQTLKTDEFQGMHSVTSLLLFSAARNELLEKQIIPWEKKHPDGITVGDRCWLSTLAYQTTEGAPISYARDIQRPFMSYPSLIAFVDILPEESFVRREAVDTNVREEDWRDRQGIKEQVKIRANYLSLCKEFRERVVIIDGFSEFWEIVLFLRNLALERMSQNPEYAVIAKAAIKDFTLVDLNKYVQTNLGSLGSDLQRQVVKQEETRRRLGAEDKQVLRRRMLDEWCQLGIQGMSF